MSNTDNGGAAFPHLPYSQSSTQWSDGSQGMTLRDYFAAAALTGLISTGNYGLLTSQCSAVAYNYADAMLAARKEGQP